MQNHVSKLAVTLLMSALFDCLPSPAGEPLAFDPVPGFVHVPEHMTIGACSAIALDSQGHIYLFHREKHPIICLDPKGRYVRSWGDALIETAHGLRIDRDDNLWVTDIGHHLVLKFDLKGKLLLALGTADKPGTASTQFNKPTDVAFDSEGNVYVSDGYGNSRIMKFSSEGKFIKTWGKGGEGPGQFNLPHTLVVDAHDRIIVGDRENDRLQVFTTEGQLLQIWPGFAPYGLTIDRDGRLFVADGRANQVLRLDGGGKVTDRWGGKGDRPGQYNLPHMLAADKDGNLFVAEVGGERLQKLLRK